MMTHAPRRLRER
jgi:hypothetical protein